MPINQFANEIDEDIIWRIDEISIIKMNVIAIPNRGKRKDVAYRYSLPAIYSVWEGFIFKTMTEYIRKLNDMQIPIKDANLDLVMNCAYDKFDLNNARNAIDKRRVLVKSIYDFMVNGVLTMPFKVPTNSNVDFECLTKIHSKYNLDLPDESKFQACLDKHVNLRNKVSHGDNSIRIDQTHIDAFANCVIDLMYDIKEIVIKNIANASYNINPIS